MAGNIDINLTMNMFFLTVLLSIILGGLLGKLIYDYILEKKEKDISKLLENANLQATKIIEKAREQSQKIIEKAENKATKLIKSIENKEKALLEEEKKLLEKEKELDKLLNEAKEKVYQIANLTPQEAKEKIFLEIKKEFENDLVNLIEKVKRSYFESAKKEASNIIAKTLYRVATTGGTNKFLVETIQLPSEDYKGRIIGREGRNIQFFEKTTGVNLIIDDTPSVIKLSAFNPEKRFIAKVVLEKLIKDGRINPVYIEKHYEETLKELPEIFREIGKETLIELGIPIMQPEILEYIGKFELRYSYGQNLLEHSKEVARISELLANELGFDGLLAKKAGLLHDIGKIDVSSAQSHAKVGADILRKFNFSEEVVNAAESHHFEVEPTSPISWIVAAADAISAGREGARNNISEKYIERIQSLENLVKEVIGVKKVYIMQAGREIRAFVDEDLVSDFEINQINKEIKKKIEANLDYPGVIKVVTIRENTVISYVG